MPKASAKANATAKSVASVKVSAKVIALITATATADAGVMAATKAAGQTLVTLADSIRSDKLLFSLERDALRDALKVHFVQAYKAINKDELYAGQQLARTIGYVWPGGKNASKEDSEKQRVHLERGVKEKLGVNQLNKLASGSLKYSKKGELIETKKSRRAHNAKTPLETLKSSVDNAITAASTAKLTLIQIGNAVIDALTACEILDKEDAEKLQELFEEIG